MAIIIKTGYMKNVSNDHARRLNMDCLCGLGTVLTEMLCY